MHARDVHIHPRAGLRGRFRGRARQPGRAQILHPDREPSVQQRERRLDEPLLLERIADLHRRSFGLGSFLEPGGREHARTADAVTSGRRAEQHREVAGTFGARRDETLARQETEAEHVDERVLAVTVVEDRFAADRGYANRVAVTADPGDDALEQIAAAGVIQRTEPQRVHERDRARAHREHVAHDASDSGGGALIRLDGRRVVVALDSHRHRETIADVDHTGAFTGTDEHPRCLGGKAPQVELRRLVRAVLRPHHRVHGQLDLSWLASEEPDDVGQLGVGEPELLVQRSFGVAPGHALSLRRQSRRACVRPSAPADFRLWCPADLQILPDRSLPICRPGK